LLRLPLLNINKDFKFIKTCSVICLKTTGVFSMRLAAKMIKIFIALYCTITFSTAQAVSVSFDQSTVLTPPDVFSLNLLIDFSDNPTSGGAVDIMWDPTLLQYNSDFTFDAGFTSPDPFFDVIDFQAPGLLSVGFGTLSALIADNTTAGALSFTSLSSNTATISFQDSIVYAGFFGGEGQPLTVNYTDTIVNPVPLPAAVWLMLSGLGLLGMVSKRRESA
jgi:hypothetical protein